MANFQHEAYYSTVDLRTAYKTLLQDTPTLELKRLLETYAHLTPHGMQNKIIELVRTILKAENIDIRPILRFGKFPPKEYKLLLGAAAYLELRIAGAYIPVVNADIDSWIAGINYWDRGNLQ